MKMVIHQRPHRVTRINIYGLIDQEDVRILAYESACLMQAGQEHFVIDLSRCTRICESIFEFFHDFNQHLKSQSGSLTFIAPQKSLYFKLLDYHLHVKLHKQDTFFEQELLK